MVATLDKHSLDTFGPLMDKLSENMQLTDARAVAIRFVVALVRAAIGKGSKDLGFPVGKIGAMPWGEEKIMAIKKSWTTWVERGHPCAKGLKLALGFQEDDYLGQDGVAVEEAQRVRQRPAAAAAARARRIAVLRRAPPAVDHGHRRPVRPAHEPFRSE